MTFFITVSRYVLPALMIFIIVKCLIALLFGRPRKNIIAHLRNVATNEQLKLEMWETAIGRSRACDIILDYPTVSKFHAVIARRVNGWFIYDLNSKNGISVNDERIDRKAEIENDDMISLGEGVTFRFNVDNDPIIRLSRKQLKRMKKEAELRRKAAPYSQPDQAFTDEKRYYPPKTEFTDVYSSSTTPSAEAAHGPSLVSSFGSITRLSGINLLIGRSAGCGLILNEADVEPVHASIDLYEDGSWVVSNLSRSATTFLNGVRVTEPQILIEGDRLSFGAESFTYTEKL